MSVIRTDGTANEAWAEIDVGPQSDMWVTFSIYMDAASFALWVSSSPNLYMLLAPDTFSTVDAMYIGGGPSWGTAWGAGGGTPAGDTWFVIEVHHVTSLTADLYVDGVLTDAAVDLSGFDGEFLRVGQNNVPPTNPSLAYYTDVKVGTSRGGTELFSWPSSSTDLSAFTDTFGDVTVTAGPVTPTVPDPPTLDTATPGDTTVDLSWSAPYDGGSALTGYNIYSGISSGGETLLDNVGAGTTVYNDTGLTNGTVYFYKVSAVNIVGESALSNELSATPATIPDAPILVSAVEGPGSVALTWTAPLDDGGSPITGYGLYRGLGSGSETLIVTLPAITYYADLVVDPGTTYFYKVSAINAVGEGPLSNELAATPEDATEIVYTRVYGITITLSDDGVENVSRLTTSPQGFS